MTIFEIGIFIIIHIKFVHHLKNTVPIDASIAETITLINQAEKIIGPKRFSYIENLIRDLTFFIFFVSFFLFLPFCCLSFK